SVAPRPVTRAAIAAPMPRDAPVMTTVRPASDAVPSATAVLDEVARRFPQPDALEPACRNARDQLLPDENGNVLRGWQPVGKPGNVKVEVAVVELGVDVLVKKGLHDAHVDDVAGVRLDLTVHAELDFV